MLNNKFQIRNDWKQRQHEFGNDPRSVLMKGLHPLINGFIDSWHREVVRFAFSGISGFPSKLVLDVGCGFGRLANEVQSLGFFPIGIDFTHAFCSVFAGKYDASVCADLVALPFLNDSFDAAYSVTSLMYVDREEARLALIELDRCLRIDARCLVLEPCQEFNNIVRLIFPSKKRDRLAVPGFTLAEFQRGLFPNTWNIVASGNCRWMTFLLPLMMLTTWWPKCCRLIAKIAIKLDHPSNYRQYPTGKISMYRWVYFRKVK